MPPDAIIWGGLALALLMFFTWALEMHRSLREVLEELRGIRRELERRDREPPPYR